MIHDRLLASVLKMHRVNKIYKFISTWTVSISTRQFNYTKDLTNKGCVKYMFEFNNKTK